MSGAVRGHLSIFIVIKISFLPKVHRLGAWMISQATLWTSEIMAEECGMRGCGHVIHPHVWRKTNFTRGIKKTTEQKAVCEKQNPLPAPVAPLWQREAPYQNARLVLGTVAVQEWAWAWAQNMQWPHPKGPGWSSPARHSGDTNGGTQSFNALISGTPALHPKSGKWSCQGTRMSKTTVKHSAGWKCLPTRAGYKWRRKTACHDTQLCCAYHPSDIILEQLLAL